MSLEATINSLREERDRAIREARAKAEQAEIEGRPMTAEERQFVDKILGGVHPKTKERIVGEEERMLERIQQLEGDANSLGRLRGLESQNKNPVNAIAQQVMAQQAAAAGNDGAAADGSNLSKRGKVSRKEERQYRQKLQSDAFRAWCLAGTGHMRPEWRDAAQKANMPFTAELEFSMPWRQERQNFYRANDPAAFYAGEKRAGTVPTQTSVIGTSGAYIVPETMMSTIEVALKEYWNLDVVTHIKTAGVGPLVYPQNNDTTTKGNRITDGQQVVAKNITLSTLTLQGYTYTSNVVLVPITLMTDTAVPIEPLVGRLLGIRIGRILADEMTTGTGNGQPYGIVSAATLGQTAALSTAVSADDLYNLEHSVDPAYRVGPKVGFMLHDKILLQVKLLKSGIGTYLWQNGLATGKPDTIDGYPYYINQSMVSTVASTNKTILFGDLSKYMVREVATAWKFVRLVERYMDQAAVGFIAYAIYDGGLNDAGTHPVTYLQH